MKISDIVNDIYDYENRWYMIEKVAESFGIDDITKILLEFIVMGNVSTNATLPEILKKFKLPVKDAVYDRDKLIRWTDMIAKEMESLDKYGVLKMDSAQLIRESQNGKYLTIATMQIDYIVYYSIYKLLKEKPDYVIKVLFGVFEALRTILKFLEVKEIGGTQI